MSYRAAGLTIDDQAEGMFKILYIYRLPIAGASGIFFHTLSQASLLKPSCKHKCVRDDFGCEVRMRHLIKRVDEGA